MTVGRKMNKINTFKARKKPLVVEVYQTKHDMIIDTLEGQMNAKKGDYIIKGIEGEEWSVKKEIFEKTYERVE